jgi:hypothetical protein
MRSSLRSGAALVLTVLVAFAGAPAAFALSASQSFAKPGEQAFVVPPGVTSVAVVLVGGNGGVGDSGAPAGVPATVDATLAVVPGETLYAEVAGDGGSGTAAGQGAGGSGGGGPGGDVFALFGSATAAGGGGGASDVRTCAAASTSCTSLGSRLVVAGGGGGGAGGGNNGNVQIGGGAGGAADQSGDAGSGDGTNTDPAGTGGIRATSSAGGAAGMGGDGPTPGALSLGGTGGGTAIVGGPGGGGGGGIYGGGGGGGGGGHTTSTNTASGSGGGGGGGGSSGVPSGATGVSGFSLVPTATSAEPQITFTWTAPAPAVLTGAASVLGPASATLTGTVNPNDTQITACHFTIVPAPAAGAQLPCAQQLGGGGTPVAVSAAVDQLLPSTTYSVSLTASSAAGSSTGAPVTFTTPAVGTSLTGAAVPVITKLKIARRIHRTPVRKRAAPVTISLTLSEAATLRLTFARQRTGYRSHGRCVASSRPPRHAAKCTVIARAAGTLTVSGGAGVNRIRFTGTLDGRRRLALGVYRVTIVASTVQGQASRPARGTLSLIR